MKEGESLVSSPMLLLDVKLSSVSQVNLFSGCHKSPFTLSSLQLMLLSFNSYDSAGICHPLFCYDAV